MSRISLESSGRCESRVRYGVARRRSSVRRGVAEHCFRASRVLVARCCGALWSLSVANGDVSNSRCDALGILRRCNPQGTQHRRGEASIARIGVAKADASSVRRNIRCCDRVNGASRNSRWVRRSAASSVFSNRRCEDRASRIQSRLSRRCEASSVLPGRRCEKGVAMIHTRRCELKEALRTKNQGLLGQSALRIISVGVANDASRVCETNQSSYGAASGLLSKSGRRCDKVANGVASGSNL